MKIGIDVRCLAQGRNTGVEGYTKNLLRAIFDADAHNEYILFFNAWKGNSVDFSWVNTYHNVSVKSYTIPNKLLNASLWFLQYPKIDKLCGGLDAFFMTNSNFVALSPDVKFFFTAHDLSFEHYKNAFSLKRRLWHFLVNPRLLMQKANHIFAVSESTKEDIHKTYHVSTHKISVTLNGPTSVSGPVSRNSIDLLRVKEKYKLPYEFILYFGTIEPRKNIVSVIQGFDALRKGEGDMKHKLVIAGATGWKSKEIMDAIESAEYAHDIILIFDVLEEEKVALYTMASVFVYPSFFEGFGFPPLEAMMCGTPTIVSHTTSLPEVVSKYAVMIDPFRQDEITRAMSEVLCRNTKTQFIATDESVRHARSFTWKNTAKKIIYAFC